MQNANPAGDPHAYQARSTRQHENPKSHCPVGPWPSACGSVQSRHPRQRSALGVNLAILALFWLPGVTTSAKTNNKQQTTNNKQQTTNNKQQTTNNKQQTTNNKQQTINNKQQTTISLSPSLSLSLCPSRARTIHSFAAERQVFPLSSTWPSWHCFGRRRRR